MAYAAKKTVGFTNVDFLHRPEAFIDAPQIVLITADTWRVTGAFRTQSGLFKFCTLPPLPTNTPIVNIESLSQDARLYKILRDHFSPAGCDNVDTTVRLLVGIGATAIYSV